MARATSSLPVPEAPVSMTVERASAMDSIRSKISFITLDLPTRFWNLLLRSRRISAFSRRRSRISEARAVICSSVSGTIGLMRKSSAPNLIALTAVSIVPKAVIIITIVSGVVFLTCLSNSMPSMPGIFRSDRTMSASRSFSSASASSAEWAVRQS